MTIIVLFYTELKQTILNSWYSTSEPWAAAGGEPAFALWKLGLRIKIL